MNSFKKMFLFFSVMLLSYNAAADLNLNSKQKKILKQYDSRFKIYDTSDYANSVIELFKTTPDESPMLIKGDFDGNGQMDLALMGHNTSEAKVLILLRLKGKYQIHKIATFKHEDPHKQILELDYGNTEVGMSQYLSLLPANRLNFSKKSIKRDALQIENYLGDTRAYYFSSSNKTFKEYTGEVN